MREVYPIYRPARSYDELPCYLTLPEVAALCSITHYGAAYWVKKGQLPARRAGGTWLVKKADVSKFAHKRDIILIYGAIERES